MSKNTVFLILLVCGVAYCESYIGQNDLEARGKKKKKIALFVYIADLVLKKFFILKLVYAFIFWVVLHKAGYFLAWFASYLKEKKHHEHHDHHEYHGHDHHYDYQPAYGAYGPYRRKNH
ncbi:uncharacterized protein LOC114358577 [Ostrinia furnacalis]|uniref:uncharacterized protein LOC114358577 n=1 Tax=Ostrinia furnacalis TaxID=93504 RepID=UPI00103F6308|nr:uncharacterized protein LOC114358577 [Ostrinia furnacalis]